MDFFSDCKTKEDAKEIYRKLAKLFHPDRGGDKDIMMELTRQLDAWQPTNEYRSMFNTTYSRFDRLTTIQDDKKLHEARDRIARQDQEITQYRNAVNQYKNLYDEQTRNIKNERNMYADSLEMRDDHIHRLQLENKDLEYELNIYENMNIWQRIKFLLYPEYGKGI